MGMLWERWQITNSHHHLIRGNGAFSTKRKKWQNLTNNFQCFTVERISHHTCSKWIHCTLLNTKPFLVFHKLQRTTLVIKLRMGHFLSATQNLEMDSKSSPRRLLKNCETTFQVCWDTTHSKNNWWTVAFSLQKTHSTGFSKPLFLRLSLVITLLWDTSQIKINTFGGATILQIAGM